ncbi:MAG: methyltransferase domain-containing protein [Deltaproteobacteria bacterium]|nr:methyltransferase domain-containing protein [Deltaproteobacteria bacterium]
MIDLPAIATKLEQRADGIWVSRNRSDVHYPSFGSDVCFEIEDTSFWFAHRNACVTAMCRRRLSERVVFDIGGGNGFVSLGLQRAGFETVLVEPSPSAMHHAATRDIAHRVCSTFDDAGFVDGAAPNVGLFDVLEHIAEPVSFLRGIRRILHPGGSLVLTVPAYNALWSHEDVIAQHHRRYTRTSLRTQLESAGFAIAESTYFFSFLPIPILLARALPWRLGLLKDEAVTRTSAQHRPPGGIAKRVLDALCGFELRRIERGSSLPLGGSILAVAR